MATVSHNAGECREALARTSQPIVLDLETTGVKRSDKIVSAGLLVDDTPRILFVRSAHASIRNLPREQFFEALRPLERPDLIVIGHNLQFDVGCLHREGIRVKGEIRDTIKLLRLLDQDRGAEGGHDKHAPRIDLGASGGPKPMNYRLKDVVPQLLGKRMRNFPGQIELAPYDIHARYLACDLLGTKALYEHLWPKLTDGERAYYLALVAPLIPVLVDMTEQGVLADCDFCATESGRLRELLLQLSTKHQADFGIPLGMDERQMQEWLFKTLKLPVLRRKRQGNWAPSLDAEALRQLQAYNEDPKVAQSLGLITEYRQTASLGTRLASLPEYIGPTDSGRFHSTFDDRQATGRVSSTKPNLQQLAKVKTIAGQEFRSRNVLVASPGYEFVGFDIGQADIRALAHAVESLERTTQEHQLELRRARQEMLDDKIRHYDELRERHRNPNFTGEVTLPPQFDPAMTSDLAADFQNAHGDFYSTAVRRITGRDPRDKAERNRYKVVILSTVNGQGPPALAKQLGCSAAEAKEFLNIFDESYPKVAAFKWLMNWQVAFTGQTRTFMGRPRTVTAHRWLVTEPEVEILVSGKYTEPCWVRIVPLRPRFRVLTSYVLKAWNGDRSRLIYDHQRGRLSPRRYHLFENNDMEYVLPIRNWAWRSIRRVRAHGEEAQYEGFDATARAAFNFICQGGTADICKLMMLRAQPVCQRFGARLLIQIHDELVFEVPKERATEFIGIMKTVLEEPPVSGFKVPIVVEPKRGLRFGDLVNV